ncbi:hypothetical protein CVT25_004239, partial [Psilocybe cyanescens]
TGGTTCVSGSTCVYSNQYYSQCLPGSASSSTSSTKSSTSSSSTSVPTTSTSTTSSTAPSSTPSNMSPEWVAAYTKAQIALKKLSLQDKVNLATGVGWQNGNCVGNIPAVSSMSFPGLCLEDSPLGVRYADFVSAFPAAINVAATFNRTLMRSRGAALGAEFRGKGVHVALGPMMNLVRVPAAGRNWEGFGSDPYLSGEGAYETIMGVQSNGVQVNGSFACENDKMLNGILKGEFGFPGYVMSDWAATHSTLSVNKGLDMTMPGDITFSSGTTYFGNALVSAVQSGSVPQSRVDDMATRILAAWYLMGQDSGFPPVNFNAWNLNAPVNTHVNVQADHKNVIRDIAAASTVLLKNAGSVLPLKAPKTIGIIGNGAGPNSKGMNGYTDRGGNDGVLAMGWGSGTVDFPYLITPLDAIKSRATVDQTTVSSSLSDTDLNTAATVAAGKSVALVFITADSGEGYITVEGNAGDRNNLQAWHGGDALVAKVASVNSNTIVVVNSVGPIIVEPWINHVNGELTAVEFVRCGAAFQDRKQVGNGLVDVLYGAYNPSGRLPYTIGKTDTDYGTEIITTGSSSSNILPIPYNEGLFIDYRHFDQAKITPRFEYGFGLSYTTFQYSSLSITGSAGTDTAPSGPGSSLDPWLHTKVLTVTFSLTNNGTVAGHEIPQLYLTLPASANSPPKALKGFDSIFLTPGQTKTVTMQLSRFDLSIWNVVNQPAMLPRMSSPARLLRRSFATQAPYEKDCTSITPPYPSLIQKLDHVRKLLNRPLTLSEKILYSHIIDPEASLSTPGRIRGEAYLQLAPERVAMQDASAQMALLQFMSAGLAQCAVSTSIHCDHLIQALDGADSDLKRSIVTNQEVFDFLQSAAQKYGIEFWRPGSGIIHQIVLENYAAPGMLMLGTDSHTPNAGGLGMLAIGVGGADAVDAMTGTPWELKAPTVIGVHLTGKLNGWTTPKDLILHLAGKLTVRGGTGSILEYYGPGVASQSCTGLATIANMGAEVGATTSTFPYSSNMREYLKATGRSPVAAAADKAAAQGFLSADEGAEYDEVIEINLSELEPTINGPFTPDLATPISKFGKFIEEQGWKDEFSASLIGSCTNSSYEDMTSVADLARQAKSAGLTAKVPFLCTPGSEQIRATMERDNVTSTLEDWQRTDKKGEENAILTSFNRNFKSRNDGNNRTMNFLASPTIVTAMAFSGKLSFNPLVDTITLASGEAFRFSAPSGQDLPSSGFTPGDQSYYPPPTPQAQPEVEVVIKKDSQRLEILEPFSSPFKSSSKLELPPLKVLLRVRGKCTTDHISAAGPWLKYKGHLTNISENLLITAINDEGGDMNVAFDRDTNTSGTIPEIAKSFKARQQPWAIVVDDNYGEGSAREHAALQPRFYGVLPLWFVDKSDYTRIGSGDVLETVGLSDVFAGNPDASVRVKVTKLDGTVFEIATKHTMSADQLNWLKAGSALNYIRSAKV